MKRRIDFYQRITGRKLEEDTRRPNLSDIVHRQSKQGKSKYQLRLLGKGEKEVWITEEERYVNFHILGAPGEGKSKFLEYHIRRDIDMGNGLCLIDPSDRGDTARNVLNYCAKIGYEKVILIDPTTISEYKKIPCIAPLNAQYDNKSVDGVMEALAILFKGDYSTMRRIRRYLSALLRILARQNLTLKDAQYFSDYKLDIMERVAILENDIDRDSYVIEDLFRSPARFDEHFASTVNIMDVFWREPLRSILSNSEGIDFKRAVADGWVILVNLSSYAMTEEQAELLGVLIISQIMQAVDNLVNSKRGKWKGKYYLYIDEAGFFATPQLKTLLLRKRKSGIVLYLSHHDYEQFEGRKAVLSAIEGAARIKLMFNTVGYDDRIRMIKSLGYGGNIPPLMAAYANSDLPKQHAILKKNKEPPVRIRIPDVSEVPDAPKEYIEKLLSQSFYKDVRSTQTNTRRAQSGKVDDPETVMSPLVPFGTEKLAQTLRPDNKKSPEPPPKRPIKI